MPAFEEALPWSRDVGTVARAAVRSRLHGLLSADALDDAQLVVTELATNAFSHAPPLIRDRIELRIELERDVVRLVVIDGGTGFVPGWEGRPGGSRASGLRVVDAIATAWGVSDDGTNAVWAELASVRGVVRSRDGA